MNGMNDKSPLKIPYNPNAEMAVLGAILLDGHMNAVTIDVPLNANDFYLAEHQKIFTVMKELDDSGTPIDAVTVSDALGDSAISYIKKIFENATTSQNVIHYAKIVRQNSMRRKYVQYAQEITENASNPQVDFDALQNQVERYEWSEANVTQIETGDKVFVKSVQRIIEAWENGGDTPGQAIGLREFDALTGGLRDENLIIIGARPSMGKTMFATHIAEYIALKKHKDVLFFSLEMKSEDLMDRIIASQTSILFEKISCGNLTAEEFDMIKKAGEHPDIERIQFYRPMQGLSEIKSYCRALKRKKKAPSVVIIDYLQMLVTGNPRLGNRNNELGIISRELKLLAEELNCPVVVLSQLNRDSDKRPDKRPVLSDLRDSGAIEQDADLVVLLHREEYYDKDTTQKGMLEAIVAKARNGQTGTATLGFHPEMMQIRNIEWQIRDKDKDAAPAAEPEKEKNNGKQVSLE